MISVGDYISAISGLAALVTAALTYAVVREMGRQRQASYQPDVSVNEQTLVGYALDGTNELVSFFDAPVIADGNPLPGWPSTSYEIHLVNIGRGVARDVECTWDYAGILDALNDRLQRNVVLANIYFTDERCQDIAVDSMTDSFPHIFIPEVLSKSFAFILPSEGAAHSRTLRLPASMEVVWSMHTHLNSLGRVFEPLPPARLQLSYEDIGGMHYQKTLKLQPELFMSSYRRGIEDPRLRGLLRCTTEKRGEHGTSYQRVVTMSVYPEYPLGAPDL